MCNAPSRAHPVCHFGSQFWSQTCTKEFTPKKAEMVDTHCSEVCSALCKGSIHFKNVNKLNHLIMFFL